MPVACIQILHHKKRHHRSPTFSSILFHLHLVLLQSFFLLPFFVVCVLFLLQCKGRIKVNMATCYLQCVIWILHIYYIIFLFCIRRRHI
ncbi:hypothetical protein C0J52_28163 [Blattella germanica]|nr:hypothetical protein C0J52_28163 [Blattella germanica]